MCRKRKREGLVELSVRALSEMTAWIVICLEAVAFGAANSARYYIYRNEKGLPVFVITAVGSACKSM